MERNGTGRRATKRSVVEAAEMEKTAGGAIGARKKPVKRSRRRTFARSVVEYLTSDSYMYAPLVDAPPTTPSAAPTDDYYCPLHSKAQSRSKSTMYYATRKISIFDESSPSENACH